jgi:hypothetical protein
MSKLIVLTDLGSFKAYRMEEDGYSSSPRLETVDVFRSIYGDDRISKQVSDQAGQFTKNAPGFFSSHDQSNGERHNIWLENERRSVKQVAEAMSELLNDGEFDSCYFAASSEINDAIIEHLAPQARAKIEKNVHCNLVNAKREDILGHFP